MGASARDDAVARIVETAPQFSLPGRLLAIVLYSEAMATRTITESRTRESTQLAPRWHVVLLDDDDHTYAYVIEMLGAVFGHARAKAYRMAQEVDRTGRVIVWTGPREVAEFKQERIHSYGADARLPASKGAMSAVLEPAN